MVQLSNDQFGKPYFTKSGIGKLFRDPKPIDKHRYPWGYTPERMREVRNTHLDITHVGSDTDAFGGPGGAHRAYGVIARSTTPVEDFQSTPHGYTEDDYHPLEIMTGSPMRRGVSGMYHSTRDATYHRGLIEISGEKGEHPPGPRSRFDRSVAEHQAGQTLLHELGHYKSRMVENNPSAAYDTPTQRGKEEAVADDNKVTRYRPDPRDVRRWPGFSKTPVGAYEPSGAFQGLGGAVAHRAYVKARKTLSPEEKETINRVGYRPFQPSPPLPPIQQSLFTDRRLT